jgi:hypothetical protein
MKLITANRLTDGRVIYWTVARGWSPRIADAALLEDAHAEEELSLALKEETTEVVAPYLIEANGHEPAGRERLKESIRWQGPTVGPSKGHGAEAG